MAKDEQLLEQVNETAADTGGIGQAEGSSFKELLSAEVTAPLKVLSAVRTWLAILSIWGVIAAAVAVVALWTHPLVVVLAVVVIASRQFALAVMLHDAAHGLLFRNRALNDGVCQWLCGYPIIQDMKPYRPYHAQHHLHAETDQDPDLVLSRGWPKSKASIARKVIRDLTGIAGARRNFGILRSVSGKPDWHWSRRLAHATGRLRGFLLTNAIIFTLFAFFTHWSWYFMLWWLPNLTWYSFIYRIRNIAEHAMVPATSEYNVARTTLPPVWYRWSIAPLNVGYHAEHHLMPNCPWYNLPKLHRHLHKELAAEGGLDQLCMAPGYFAMLRSVSV